MDNVLKTIDLFCGCGGMSLGFQNAGFDIIAGYDNWAPAVEVYKKNFKHPIYQADLADPRIIDEIIVAKPDIIIGGPPCQDFSSAGHRNEKYRTPKWTRTNKQVLRLLKPIPAPLISVFLVETTAHTSTRLQHFK